MPNVIQEKVSVITVFNQDKGTVQPYKFYWNTREYKIQKIGYYHQRREGSHLFHIFDVTDGSTAFRLSCDAQNLHWTLEEVSDDNNG